MSQHTGPTLTFSWEFDSEEALEKKRALIEAAPETAAERDRLRETVAELVAVLERVEVNLSSGKWGEINGGHSNPILQHRFLRKRIRAAIAKAKL